MFAITTEDVVIVKRAAQAVQGSFDWTHVDGTFADAETVAIKAINGGVDPFFAGLHIEADEIGHVTVGLIADALNVIRHMPASTPTATMPRTCRCKSCHRPLKDKESIARGYGPECFATLAA